MLQLFVVGALEIVLVDSCQHSPIGPQLELDRLASGKMEVFPKSGNQSHGTWTLEFHFGPQCFFAQFGGFLQADGLDLSAGLEMLVRLGDHLAWGRYGFPFVSHLIERREVDFVRRSGKMRWSMTNMHAERTPTVFVE